MDYGDHAGDNLVNPWDLILQLRLLQPHTIIEDDTDGDLPDGHDPYQHTP